jgi:hypothetical protein
MTNGMPTAYRKAASDARGSRLKASPAPQIRGAEPGSTRTSRKPELYIPQTGFGAGDPWEASDWPSLRKATHPWLFDFRYHFSVDPRRPLSPVTLLFLLLGPTSPNSTCSRADYLCIIGFAYRAAEARSQMSQARRNSRESLGFSAAFALAGPKSGVQSLGQSIAVQTTPVVCLRDQTIGSTPKP